MDYKKISHDTLLVESRINHPYFTERKIWVTKTLNCLVIQFYGDPALNYNKHQMYMELPPE